MLVTNMPSPASGSSPRTIENYPKSRFFNIGSSPAVLYDKGIRTKDTYESDAARRGRMRRSDREAAKSSAPCGSFQCQASGKRQARSKQSKAL